MSCYLTPFGFEHALYRTLFLCSDQPKEKNYYLSILIRLMTLGLFGLVIVDRYETQNHLILLLLLWVGFESMEQFYARKKSDSVK